MQVRTSSGFRIKLSYDEFNRASDVQFSYSGESLKTTWVYGKDSIVTGVKYNGSEKISYTYDLLKRQTKKTVNTVNPFVISYAYTDVGDSRTGTQVRELSYSDGTAFAYTYDANGNILTVKDENGNLLASYTYDSLNQLTGAAAGTDVYAYTYDNGGNITGKTKNGVSVSYGYGNAEWKDLLTSYNGVSLSYDAIGNPLSWVHGETFTWSGGRQLTGVTKNSGSISYTYNDDGIRTGKTVNGVRTDYYLNGTAVIMQKTGDNVIWYTYDENGLKTGFIYNGTAYYYVYNLQGDVISILNESGDVAARYSYDPWGAITAITDGSGADVSASASHIANVNPIRYRGYCYDAETGLYYLNSRYYDPEVGRFVNADNVISGNGGSIQGNNLFAYCFNNPINLFDQRGNWPKLIKDIIKTVAKKIIKPAIKSVQKITSKINLTYSAGVNVSGTPSAWIFNGQIGVSIDTKGNVAIQASGGGGVTTGSSSIAITRYKSVSNAPNIDKLNGSFYQMGGSIAVPVEGIPVAAGGDVMLMPDTELNTGYFGLTENIGFGTPGKEFHVEWGETTTISCTQFNIYDISKFIYIKIMEW